MDPEHCLWLKFLRLVFEPDLEPSLQAGDGVEHEPGEGDHQAHQDEALVVGLVRIEHKP
jgi:hypothetical protein